MNTLYIMVGLPGSGKSSVSAQIAEEKNAFVFSSDTYRQVLLGDENDQSNNSYVFETLYRDLCHYLSLVGSAILDATNINRKERARALQKIQKVNCRRVAVFVNTPYHLCVQRDIEREERHVGEQVIYNMMSRFEVPMLEEGFDDIILYNHDRSFYEQEDTRKIVLSDLARMQDFDQMNYHHLNTLGVHTKKLMKRYKSGSIEYLGAKYHDIGKLYSQTIDEDGEAHYKNHANISAYYYLTLVGNMFEVAFLINYHMMYRDVMNSVAARVKFENMFGKRRCEMLSTFVMNDNWACK